MNEYQCNRSAERWSLQAKGPIFMQSTSASRLVNMYKILQRLRDKGIFASEGNDQILNRIAPAADDMARVLREFIQIDYFLARKFGGFFY
jgi:hypothetical protein